MNMLPLYVLAVRDDDSDFLPLVVPVTRIDDDGGVPTKLVHDCALPGWLCVLHMPNAPQARLTLMGEKVFSMFTAAEAELRSMHARSMREKGLRVPIPEPSAATLYELQKQQRESEPVRHERIP